MIDKLYDVENIVVSVYEVLYRINIIVYQVLNFGYRGRY